MNKYTITIIETLRRDVEVEAPNYDAARERVKEMYNREEIVLDYTDHTDTQIA